jgi:hypothetical protein
MSEPLAVALERFNRKERNLLVRAILGHDREPLHLTKNFRESLSDQLGIPVPEDAWWATDYHISWLAGALAVLVKGEAAVFLRGDDKSLPPWCNPEIPKGETKSQLVEGNQEDVDLVIATGCELIMIEAKGDDVFDRDQLESKVERLKLLHAFYRDKLRPDQNPVCFHFVLMSPVEPKEFHIDWPPWARKKDGAIPWIELGLGEDRLTVERCDPNHGRAANKGYWHVIRQRGRRNR